MLVEILPWPETDVAAPVDTATLSLPELEVEPETLPPPPPPLLPLCPHAEPHETLATIKATHNNVLIILRLP